MHKATARFALTLALTACTFGASLTVPASADSSPSVRNWTPATFRDNDVLSTDQAVSIAKRTDLVIAHFWTFSAFAIQRMREANPKLRILVYVNGMLLPERQANLVSDRSLFSYDKDDRKIISRKFVTANGQHMFLMNPLSSKWRDRVAARCANLRGDRGFNGCFVDMLGTAPLDPGYLSAQPVNPTTNSLWTPGDWLAATTKIGQRVESALGDRLVFTNGLRTGAKYFDSTSPTRQLLYNRMTGDRRVDGGVSESWLRMATFPVTKFRSEGEWRKDVNMLRDAAKHGCAVAVTVKLWTSATFSQRQRWHQYSLASLLLADTGKGYYFFSGSRTANPTGPDGMVAQARVGTPVDATYFKDGGVYQRRFRNGRVLVNPTTTARTVRLGATYRTLTGDKVTTLRLGPNTGRILLKA